MRTKSAWEQPKECLGHDECYNKSLRECYNESQRMTPEETLDEYQIIHYTTRLLERHKIWHMAHGGTLIGALRNGGIIPHDNDGDFWYLLDGEIGDAPNDFQSKVFQADLKKNGLILHEFHNEETGTEFKRLCNGAVGENVNDYTFTCGVCADLFPLVKKGTRITWPASFKGLSSKAYFPSEIAAEGALMHYDFGSTTVPAPRRYITEAFLTREYGEDWKHESSCDNVNSWHACYMVKDSDYDVTGRAMPDGPLKDPL